MKYKKHLFLPFYGHPELVSGSFGANPLIKSFALSTNKALQIPGPVLNWIQYQVRDDFTGVLRS
ncbi:MAG: hypothetical protein ED557_09530 [Balneola sp.]|nr:MAG: hypothetical protein ED557_09530 [Balneola sp.]